MKKIIPLLLIILALFSLSFVASANNINEISSEQSNFLRIVKEEEPSFINQFSDINNIEATQDISLEEIKQQNIKFIQIFANLMNIDMEKQFFSQEVKRIYKGAPYYTIYAHNNIMSFLKGETNRQNEFPWTLLSVVNTKSENNIYK